MPASQFGGIHLSQNLVFLQMKEHWNMNGESYRYSLSDLQISSQLYLGHNMLSSVSKSGSNFETEFGHRWLPQMNAEHIALVHEQVKFSPSSQFCPAFELLKPTRFHIGAVSKMEIKLLSQLTQIWWANGTFQILNDTSMSARA